MRARRSAVSQADSRVTEAATAAVSHADRIETGRIGSPAGSGLIGPKLSEAKRPKSGFYTQESG